MVTFFLFSQILLADISKEECVQDCSSANMECISYSDNGYTCSNGTTTLRVEGETLVL